MSNTTTTVALPSTSSLLGVLFIALKLTHVISWPWFWVLAPFWIPLAFVGSVLLFALSVAIIAAILK